MPNFKQSNLLAIHFLFNCLCVVKKCPGRHWAEIAPSLEFFKKKRNILARENFQIGEGRSIDHNR